MLLFPLSAGMVQQEARSFFTQPEVISPEQLPVFKWNNPGANFGTPAHGLHVTMFESQLAAPIHRENVLGGHRSGHVRLMFSLSYL